MSVEHSSWAACSCADKFMLAWLSKACCRAPDLNVTRRGLHKHRRFYLQVRNLLFQPLPLRQRICELLAQLLALLLGSCGPCALSLQLLLE